MRLPLADDPWLLWIRKRGSEQVAVHVWLAQQSASAKTVLERLTLLASLAISGQRKESPASRAASAKKHDLRPRECQLLAAPFRTCRQRRSTPNRPATAAGALALCSAAQVARAMSGQSEGRASKPSTIAVVLASAQEPATQAASDDEAQDAAS